MASILYLMVVAQTAIINNKGFTILSHKRISVPSIQFSRSGVEYTVKNVHFSTCLKKCR